MHVIIYRLVHTLNQYHVGKNKVISERTNQHCCSEWLLHSNNKSMFEVVFITVQFKISSPSFKHNNIQMVSKLYIHAKRRGYASQITIQLLKPLPSITPPIFAIFLFGCCIDLFGNHGLRLHSRYLGRPRTAHTTRRG